jgi:glycosyltransferase involved in cell wall biosynthesis
MINPLVSIIIPLYNAEDYIAETIKSAINQTWQNKEIIIVDDGSTDNSLAIAKGFENGFVKVFIQKNSGASAARNKGLTQAKGNYIQFLDADDLLSADKIENQVNLLQGKPNAVANCATVYFFDGEDAKAKLPVHEWYREGSTNNVDYLLKLYSGQIIGPGYGGMITVHAWLCPKSVIDKAGPWNEDLTVDDDGEFFCRVMLNSDEILYSEKAICYYRKYKKRASLSTARNYAANKSMLLSTTLKLQHLQHQTTDLLVNKVIARLLMENIVLLYPVNKDLYATADNLLKKLGGTDYVPILGGKVSEFLKKIFGWKAVRLISHYKNLIKSTI